MAAAVEAALPQQPPGAATTARKSPAPRRCLHIPTSDTARRRAAQGRVPRGASDEVSTNTHSREPRKLSGHAVAIPTA